MKKTLVLLLVLAMSLTFSAAAEPTSSQYMPDNISEDWTDFQFTLNGQAYQLPLPVSIFLEDGWQLDEPDVLIKPGSYMFSQGLTKEDNKVMVQILNMGIDVLPASQCLIGELGVKAGDITAENFAFELAGDIALGTTKKEASAILGTPKDTYEGTSYEKVTYKTDTYANIELYYSNDDEKIIEIKMQNFITPKGYNDEAEAAHVDLPQEAVDYKAPEALGDDIFSFNLAIDGVVYSLPAPYQYFEAQGWKLADKSDSKLPAKDSKGYIPLLYNGGFTMDVRFINPTNKANILKNCFVSSLTFEEDFPSRIELPGGITLGMSQDDLLKAIESFKLDEEKEVDVYEGNSYTQYSLRKRVLQEIEVFVQKESGMVYKIEIINNISNLSEEEE